VNAADLTAIAAVLGGLASLGTLVFAVVIWVQGLRAKTLQNVIHERVNSLSDARVEEAGAAGFTAGRAKRTEDRLDKLENGKLPPGAP
jgi:hypothetical protein